MVEPTTYLIISALATTASVVSQRQAARAQKKARRVQSRMADIEAQRERQQQVREARIKRAQLAAGAQASGVENTSSLAGAQSGLQTQLASNLSFINTTQQMGNQASGYLQKAADYSSMGNLFGAVGQVTNQFVTPDTYANLFRKDGKP